MTLKVIGAGLGRTGTMSLKLALQRLLGGKCYHMVELFEHLEEHTPLWHAAARGEPTDWDRIFDGYVATVDEPSSIMWKELMEYYPDALVILSLRDPASWWRSANATILKVKQDPPPAGPPERVAWHAMVMEIYKHIHPDGVNDPALTMASFTAHNERVKAGVPAGRLLLWQAGDGWEPLCKALKLPVPDEPFPHSNTTEEFQARQVARKADPDSNT
jgi:hypothetical protein